MAPLLAYWDIRGLAQPIRLLLEYTGTEYEEKLYKLRPASDKSEGGAGLHPLSSVDVDGWFAIKSTIGLDFPNLPYYIEGDVKLSQSNVILRYIARKSNLLGTTEQELIHVDLIENQIIDIRTAYYRTVYSPKDTYENAKAEYLKGLPDKFKALSAFLGAKPYFAGNNLTYVDFMVYEVLDIHKMFIADCLDAFPNLQQYQARIEALPAIAAYIQSPRYIKKPISAPMAQFGGER